MYVHAQAIGGLCALSSGDLEKALRAGAAIEERLPPSSDWIGDLSHVVSFLARLWNQIGRPEKAAEIIRQANNLPRGAPAVFRWAIRVEQVRLGFAGGALAERILAEVRREAELGGCRLVAAKARAMENALRGSVA
jgi:hypothetical protein